VAKKRHIPFPTEDEKLKFLGKLHKLAPKAAVLTACYTDESRQHEYEKHYSALPGLPPTIMSLGRMRYREMDDDELLCECEKVFDELVVTDRESDFLFRSTINQSHSLLWYEHRRGRLSASKFGAICCTSLDSPSKSL